MIEFHVEKRAGVTVAAIPGRQGTGQRIRRHRDQCRMDRIVGFHEKRADAPTMPGRPHRVYASMGNYIFSTELLLSELYADAQNRGQRARFRQGHSSAIDRPRRHVRLRFPDQQDSRRSGRMPRLLARCRDARRLLRSQHGSALRFADESLQPPVAAAHRRLLRRSGEVRLR